MRKEILSEKLNHTQLLREFRRWRGLMDLNQVREDLLPERTNLLDGIMNQIESIRDEFESRTGQRIEVLPGMDRPPDGIHMSELVNGIVWARQLFNKIQNNMRLTQGLLSDLPKYNDYLKQCKDTCGGIKEFENEQMNKWKNQIEDALEDTDNPLAFQMSGKLMEIDHQSGLLKVQYSERLITLLREVRQLRELDFQIPQGIEKVVEDGKKFYKEGVILKQVANFINNMESNILPSQKPMLLQAVLHFDEVVKTANIVEQKSLSKPMMPGAKAVVTWENPLELEKYIKRVQEASEGVMVENRRLRKIHDTLTDYVNELMNIDLLKNRAKWKEILDKVRSIVHAVSGGREERETHKWRKHWDYQLYKVLEHQYQLGLETLNENLPEIHADLLYSNKTVVFKPSLEELKSRYYREIRAFISIPINFIGVNGIPSIFKKMPEMNSKGLEIVFQKAEVN